MLIQNTSTDLEKKKMIHKCFPSHSLLLPFSPQTTFNLDPCRKSEDNLKLNDGGSALKALFKKERKEKHHIVMGLRVRVGSFPRRPRGAVFQVGIWDLV